jgi:hypothetical protein
MKSAKAYRRALYASHSFERGFWDVQAEKTSHAPSRESFGEFVNVLSTALHDDRVFGPRRCIVRKDCQRLPERSIRDVPERSCRLTGTLRGVYSRRRGISTMRDGGADSCPIGISRRRAGLTRQRPAALTTVAVF